MLIVVFHCRYCIDELLTHLHKSAIGNIVFGFTSTRNTNYKPGETLPVLKKLLNEKGYPQMVVRENAYCFDSGAYRYVTAATQGYRFEEEEKEWASTSWNRSHSETKRLLARIDNMIPRVTADTVSLNKARIMIIKLARPLADITKNINDNKNVIAQHLERMKALGDNIEDLKKCSVFTKVFLEKIPLAYPRTVCTNSKCVKVYKVDEVVKTTNYITWCHVPCYLENMTEELANNQALIQCSAMGGTETCLRCNHSFLEHMHITYEAREVTKQVEG